MGDWSGHRHYHHHHHRHHHHRHCHRCHHHHRHRHDFDLSVNVSGSTPLNGSRRLAVCLPATALREVKFISASSIDVFVSVLKFIFLQVKFISKTSLVNERVQKGLYPREVKSVSASLVIKL